MTDPQNPLGLAGFEFCEFTSPDPDMLATQFEQMGFVAAHRHPSRQVTRYVQGRINLLLNREPTGQAADFRALHGPSASGMAFRVADPKAAYDHAIAEGATAVDAAAGTLGEDSYPIEGIGGSYLYLVKAGEDLYADWHEVPGWREAAQENNVGLDILDHLTHNVRRGEMRTWSSFYGRLFGFE